MDSDFTPSRLMPSVRFLSESGLGEIEPDVAYAALVVPLTYGGISLWAQHNVGLLRPVKFIWGRGVAALVEDPDTEPSQIAVQDFTTHILGRWEDPVPEWYAKADGRIRGMTWQGYAAQQLGEVLRQRELAARLSEFGIAREPEAYLPFRNTTNAVQRSLVLNYDELDRLLTAAGA